MHLISVAVAAAAAVSNGEEHTQIVLATWDLPATL